MKVRKIIITLLVAVMTLSVLLAAVACTPTPPPNNNNNNKDEEEEEFDLGEMLNTEVGTIVEVVDNTVRTALSVTNSAHMGATLFANVHMAAVEATETMPAIPAIDLDLEIVVEASFDTEDAGNNAVLLEIKDVSAEGLGTIASIFARHMGEDEYVYIGQQVWSSEFEWVRLSQASTAYLLAETVSTKVFDLITGIYAESEEDIEAGIVNGMVGQFLTFIPMIAPLGIILPTTDEVTEAGFAVTAANATFAETKVAGGTELQLMVEELGGLAGVLGAFVNFGMGTVAKPGLQATLTEAGLFGLVDLLVGAILGQSYTELFVEQASTVGVLYPTIGIGIGHDGEQLTGIGLHYDYTNNPDLPLTLDLGVKDLIISGQSVDTIEPSVTGFAAAEEAAIELTMDVILDGGDVDSTIKVYAYPEITIELLDYEDAEENVIPFINLDLTGIKGFATITDNAKEGVATIFADFNQERIDGAQKGFKLDLAPVLSALNLETGYTPKELQYFIPLDAQKMWNDYFTANTTGFTPVANQSIVDDIMETVEAQFADGFAIGDIMAFLDFVGPVVDAMEGLVGIGNPILVSAFTDGDRSAAAMIDISALMDELLATGGIIETTETFEFTQYYNNETGALLETPVVGDLADYLAADAVIDSVVTLMNYNFGVAQANDVYAQANPNATEEEIKAQMEKYFDGDAETITTWTLAPISPEDLFTAEDAIRIFAAVTGKTLNPADAYSGLFLQAFVSLGASEQTDNEGITLSVKLMDGQSTLVNVALNINITGANTTALSDYEASNFAQIGFEQYTDTSLDGGASLLGFLLDRVVEFAEVEPIV